MREQQSKITGSNTTTTGRRRIQKQLPDASMRDVRTPKPTRRAISSTRRRSRCTYVKREILAPALAISDRPSPKNKINQKRRITLPSHRVLKAHRRQRIPAPPPLVKKETKKSSPPLKTSPQSADVPPPLNPLSRRPLPRRFSLQPACVCMCEFVLDRTCRDSNSHA